MSDDLKLKRNEVNYIRPPVRRFVMEMEKILQEYDAIKGSDGWRNESIEWLFERLVQEVFELYGTIFVESRFIPTAAKKECCDVANFAMMIFDRLEDYTRKKKENKEEVEKMLCPICRSRDIFKQWHLTCHPTAEGPYCSFGDYDKMDEEHLHYYCRDCGFDWSVKIERTKGKEDDD